MLISALCRKTKTKKSKTAHNEDLTILPIFLEKEKQ
jgi:hypothetical protein